MAIATDRHSAAGGVGVAERVKDAIDGAGDRIRRLLCVCAAPGNGDDNEGGGNTLHGTSIRCA
jgi:hypothetical protein